MQKIWKLTDSKKRKRQLDKQTNKIDRQTKHRQIDRHKHTYKESKTDRERTDRERKKIQTDKNRHTKNRQTDGQKSSRWKHPVGVTHKRKYGHPGEKKS